MTMKKEIGFSQRIRLEWLEKAAELLSEGKTKNEIEAVLYEILTEQLQSKGNPKRGSREKAMTILFKIWVSVPETMQPLKEDAITYFRKLPLNDHIILHWGLSMAVYPFFGTMAETVGRLLKLQESFTPAQVLRRIKEQYGERETVTRATKRVLRCFVDWGVLKDATKKGIYLPVTPHVITNKKLIAWLVEAILISGNSHSGLISVIRQSPILFPFTLEQFSQQDLANNKRLEFFHQGVNELVVAIKNNGR